MATIHATSVLLQCYDTNDFDRVQGILADRQAGFHSYTHRKARQVRLVLEHAPPYMSTADLKTALGNLGLQVAHMVRVNHRDGTPSDNIMVGFVHGTLLEDVKAVHYIDHCRVAWRPFRNSKTRVLQCSNCFRYNHVARNCHHVPVCSSCGRSHTSTEACRSELHCVQCKTEGHLPGTSACPKHREAIARRVARTAKSPRQRTPLARPLLSDQDAFPALCPGPPPHQSTARLLAVQQEPRPTIAPRRRRGSGGWDPFPQPDASPSEPPVHLGNPSSTGVTPPQHLHAAPSSNRQPRAPKPTPSYAASPSMRDTPRPRQFDLPRCHVEVNSTDTSPEHPSDPAPAVTLPHQTPEALLRTVVATVNANPEMLHPSVSPAVFLENTTIVLSALLQETDRTELTRLVSRYMMVMFFFGYDSTA